MARPWKDLRDNFEGFKSTMRMQALANYICTTFLESEQDRIINGLADPNLQAHVKVEIYFTEHEPKPAKPEGE